MRKRMELMVREVQQQVCDMVVRLGGGEFRKDEWSRDDGGGGTTRVLEDGEVFEKAGVNVSVVHGDLPSEIMESARGRGIQDLAGPARFFATGVSLVLHPRNPMAPTSHANYRYFELESPEQDPVWWFGGGTDLTPYYLFEEDAVHFHQTLKEVCDRHDPGFHPLFKAGCDDYFHLPHRNERRGVGGIFFDNLNDRDPDALFSFSQDCAHAIVPALEPIYSRRVGMPFTDEQRQWQLLRRGRYVEFNLVYDRGTTFGLKTRGRTESILMSLPPTVCWEYDHTPRDGSEEARLLEVLQTPREWV